VSTMAGRFFLFGSTYIKNAPAAIIAKAATIQLHCYIRFVNFISTQYYLQIETNLPKNKDSILQIINMAPPQPQRPQSYKPKEPAKPKRERTQTGSLSAYRFFWKGSKWHAFLRPTKVGGFEGAKSEGLAYIQNQKLEQRPGTSKTENFACLNCLQPNPTQLGHPGLTQPSTHNLYRCL
jgi:hypothetical protein